MKIRKAKKAVRASQRKGVGHPCGFVHFMKYAQIGKNIKPSDASQGLMGFLGKFKAESALIPDGMGGIKEITTQEEFEDFLDSRKR